MECVKGRKGHKHRDAINAINYSVMPGSSLSAQLVKNQNKWYIHLTTPVLNKLKQNPRPDMFQFQSGEEDSAKVFARFLEALEKGSVIFAIDPGVRTFLAMFCNLGIGMLFGGNNFINNTNKVYR